VNFTQLSTIKYTFIPPPSTIPFVFKIWTHHALSPEISNSKECSQLQEMKRFYHCNIQMHLSEFLYLIEEIIYISSFGMKEKA